MVRYFIRIASIESIQARVALVANSSFSLAQAHPKIAPIKYLVTENNNVGKKYCSFQISSISKIVPSLFPTLTSVHNKILIFIFFNA